MLHNVSFHSLSVFAAVVETGGFNQAGQRVHLTQPAVSMQIQRLEALLGMSLLCRKRGRLVGLTEAGTILYECARDLLKHVNVTEDLLNRLKKGSSGRLRVGVNTTLGNYVTRKVLDEFRSQNPTAEVSVLIDQQAHISVALEAGELDVAYVADWGLPMNLPMTVIGAEPLVAVAAAHHPLVRKQAVTLADLSPFPLLAGLRGSGHWLWVTRHLRTSGLLPHFRMVELSDADAVKAGLRDGHSVALLLHCAVADELAARHLALIPMTDGPFHIPLAVTYPTSSPLVEQFLLQLRRHEGKRLQRNTQTVLPKLQTLGSAARSSDEESTRASSQRVFT